ncbi:PRAME family member 12-like [Acomys russatus]|uniref:PRAME family member 12-like n=1 Tax=Acomys russatus TaxID=60746 RepID=UPI0021E3094D|nr:PRAME family member 12-like [Acomys russatus]
MSVHDPLTLLQLAVQGLLRNDALSISALDNLPIELFPPLFKQAFDGRHTKILKAMVAAWPFPCLPVGVLMNSPEVETLQAVLDGIDILLMKKAHPRRCKLQVLELRKVHQNFWHVWAGREDGAGSAEKGSKKQVVKRLPRNSQRQPLKLVTDLSLCNQLEGHQKCLLQWAQKRKGSVQMCCLKMQICDSPAEMVREVLDIFKPHYIEELELLIYHVLPFLGGFAPYLGLMRNLRTLHLSLAYVNTDRVPIEKCLNKFLTQFSKLNCLQHLYMNGINLFTDHMKQLCRCLKTQFESLSMILCCLSQSDLKYLSRCQSLCQLKHLEFSGILLSTSHPTGLRLLLENVADTLQTLELDNCSLEDSHLSVLLPALSQCSQLTRVNFYDNLLSSAALKDLLQCMANLNKLRVELYPAPLECYDHRGHILVETFDQQCPGLLDILMAKRQSKKIVFATAMCFKCHQRCVYDRKTRLCPCWQ